MGEVPQEPESTRDLRYAQAAEFYPFPKISRFQREIIITEKIDGTNACICITEPGDGDQFLIGSRTRWIKPGDDNFGFAAWATAHEEELRQLGPGRHYGEWWGSGILRGYGLSKGDKRFSLFNVHRWGETRPACCEVVPVLYRGPLAMRPVGQGIARLREQGSMAAPGFMKPEGVIVFHTAANICFKQTLEKDDEWKGKAS